jgi:hypothetical protein
MRCARAAMMRTPAIGSIAAFRRRAATCEPYEADNNQCDKSHPHKRLVHSQAKNITSMAEGIGPRDSEQAFAHNMEMCSPAVLRFGCSIRGASREIGPAA